MSKDTEIDIFKKRILRQLLRRGRHMEIVGKDATFPLTYGDSIIISHWAYEAMTVMVENNIMRGISEAELSPKDLATVKESIMLVLRSQQVIKLNMETLMVEDAKTAPLDSK